MSQIGKPPCDDALILSGRESSPCNLSSRRWVLAAAIGASSMAFIDGTVVNVALPAIQRDLHASAFDVQWVVESYALLLAALVVVGGSLGDRFGRRRIFSIGVAIFALASIGCALSDDLDRLVAARAVQGFGAALLVPGSLALISASFPVGERGRAIGTWSGFSGITAALGPVLGGYLIDHGSWTWAFLINLPLAVIVLSIVWWRVPVGRSSPGAGGLDPWGALLASVALGAIVYALIELPTRHWTSTAVRIALTAGVAASIAFVAVEQRVRSPMLPVGLLRNRDFGGANLLTLLLYAALGGALFFVPLNLIQVQGYSSTAAGAAMLPFVLIMFVMSRWSGTLIDRFGPKGPLVVGPVIAAAGFALFARPAIEAGASAYWTSYFPAVVVLGLGMTITVAPLTATVMNSVGTDLAGTASGVNNAVSRTAALIAIPLFSLVVATAFDARLSQWLNEARVPVEIKGLLEAQRGKLAGAELPSGMDAAIASMFDRAVKVSYVSGFRWVMLLAAGLALSSALAAWVMIDGGFRATRTSMR